MVIEQPRGDEEGHDGEFQNQALASPLNRIAKAFKSSPAEGLFVLATHPLESTWPPSFGYWRDFAARYLSKLCQTPEGTDDQVAKISLPDPSELATLVLCVPPMPGAEYVSRDHLEEIWRDLDAWVCGQITSSREGLSGFLKERAPLWHQVGRVSFHLAENRRDPDYPFAFLATYAASVTSGGRVQYQPLSKALEQYAGAKNKSALIKLLSPVQLASEASLLVREMVDSGDVYHPLAWTPEQAYRFLQDVPQFEKSGILVRVPDWWKKRPRPSVGVTIGESRQKKFDVDALLDFKVKLALGDEELSEAEWRELIASDEGLVLLRGQWVEVDRDKLTEALDHWKQIEELSADGLSFIDGMRLLAGAPMDLNAKSEQEAGQRDWSFVNAGDWLGQILTDLRSPQNLRNTGPGDDLHATLREYQETGVNWLCFLSRLGLGACLADDMGLGKTIQVLALLLVLKKKEGKQPSLLVLPASLLANWEAEIRRFAPTLRFRFVHPSQTAKDELAAMAADPVKALKNTDVVLTTYGMLLRQSWLLEVPMAIGYSRRSSGYQESSGSANENRQTAQGRVPDRADRHTRRKSAL